MAEENMVENAMNNAGDNEMDEGSDQETFGGKQRGNGKSSKSNNSRTRPNVRMPPSKVVKRKGSSPNPVTLNVIKKPWPVKEETYEEDEEDSEETEEDRENIEDGWRYAENNDDDDEETEYED